MALPIVHHPDYGAELPPGHRFPMGKFARLMAHLRTAGLARPDQLHRPEPADRALLGHAHEISYVDAVLQQSLAPAAQRRIGLPITAAVARRACAANGGTLLTAELALAHGLACNTAGGSHHAFAGEGAGFCVFNDVAVAARALLARGRIGRALVVDLDVHQGDGTAAICAAEPRIFTFSMHCKTNYPPRKQRSDLDVELAPLTGDDVYLATLADHLPGLLAAQRPDLVFYNAGVDPHAQDRLGRLALSDAGLAARERCVLATCLGAGVPVAAVIGGGYDDLDRLAARHAVLHTVASDLFARL